ncbi:MAG: rRNA maturation RNase YbeY [Cyanobacteria bacterium J06638_7]
MAAGLDLDLAFAVEAAAPADSDGAAAWLDPGSGEQLWRQLLGGWLQQLSPGLQPELRATAYSLGLRLVDDGAIAALNARWRRQSGPTDVLAFAARDTGLDQLQPLPLPGPAEAEPLELGDIVIALPTAARQAPAHGHDLLRELQFLASHGLLHLLGWDHPDEASLEAMLARQERLLTGPGQPG